MFLYSLSFFHNILIFTRMEKFQIGQIFDCNRVIFKIIEQQLKFPIYIGIKLYGLSKKFDEVEEYVFKVMETAFGEFDFMSMTKEQEILFNKLLNEEIELEIEKIPSKYFENNENVTLTVEEIGKLMIILEQNKE